ncbi:MAG: insulinase family protein [Ignavibacteriae bacterium]|nr:insulinase family protein [Ignavibacteria bacterium]MBI3365455.1 insulinase family protein [Ignavibacteriota bacterium]
MKTRIEKVIFGLLLMIATMQTVSADDKIDRTQRPTGKPAPKIHLPEIQKATLKNGLMVWLVEDHELPTVAFNLVMNAGADHDPLAQPGLASITADMMDEGTKARSALQISEELDAVGASLGTSSNLDGSYVTLNTLSKYLPKSLDVFADVVAHPTFPDKEFQRIRKQRLATLLQQKDQPPAIATNAYYYLLYGSNHPYGNNPSGSEASLNVMATSDLVAFYQKYLRPNNAILIVVGDTKLAEITSRLESALADWQPGDVASLTVPPPPVQDKMHVYLIDKPGAPQSEVRIGYPSLPRSTPDFFPVTVMNRILGGQFSSRINMNLRERHGYTYGAGTSFRFLKGIGPFTASGGIVTEKTDSSLIEFMHEINTMWEKGMSSEELSFAKKGLLGNFALAFETPAQIAGALQNVILYGLPENYFNTYLQNIDAVSLDDVQRVAKKYLDASKMAVVVVGDLARIKEGVAALKLGDIVLCDIDGHPIP